MVSFILSLQVVKGLLKFWPKTCSQKEVNSVSLFPDDTCLAYDCNVANDCSNGIFIDLLFSNSCVVKFVT